MLATAFTYIKQSVALTGRNTIVPP